MVARSLTACSSQLTHHTMPNRHSVNNFVKKAFAKLKRLLKKKKIRTILIVFIIAIICLIALIKINPFSNTEKTKEENPTLITEQDKTAEVPFFETLIPAGKSIEQLGGWTRISPKDKNAVFAFTDSIDNNRIVVGQQPLPEDFKENTEEQLESLAKTYKSSEKVTVNGTTIHIASSAKGPQAVIFVKNGILVNIRSSVTLTQDKWIDYVNSLQ